jgi:ankyrin repeat protein
VHLAVIKGHIDILESLLMHKADVNVKDGNGNTCLHLAMILSKANASKA